MAPTPAQLHLALVLTLALGLGLGGASAAPSSRLGSGGLLELASLDVQMSVDAGLGLASTVATFVVTNPGMPLPSS